MESVWRGKPARDYNRSGNIIRRVEKGFGRNWPEDKFNVNSVPHFFQNSDVKPIWR